MKRFLATLLTMTLLAGVLPVRVLAAENETQTEVPAAEAVEAAAEAETAEDPAEAGEALAVELLASTPSTTQNSPTKLTVGKQVSYTNSTTSTQIYYFKITTTKPGQLVLLQDYDDGDAGSYMTTSSATNCLTPLYLHSSEHYFGTAEAGIYTFSIHCYSSSTISFTPVLVDNDAWESNDTADTATALESDVETSFLIGYGDMDYFSLVTTKPGQDVQIDLSGFSYAVQGRVYCSFDESSGQYLTSNGTLYYHASEAGTHTLKFYDAYNSIDSTAWLPLMVTATVLDGDGNEPNDTRAKATELTIGTDAHFSVGGYGDEDWFRFDAEAGEQYTLRFLDQNTDYSDRFYYVVYDPDGVALNSKTLVTYRHSYILSAAQTGTYTVRVYPYNGTRTGTLRIRVDEGGDDPYENNDTWLTAAYVEAGTPVQHILSTNTDEDWFRFDVPYADMTVAMTFDSALTYRLYSGETLQEQGVSSYNYLCSKSTTSGTTYYYKFTDPGTYYLRLTSTQSDVTEDLRTLTFTLEEARDAENNDTWKNATQVYAGVPQAFDISAANDTDWFQFTVPENVGTLKLSAGGNVRMRVYRQSDIDAAGDNASSAMYSNGSALRLDSPTAGTYYVCCYSWTSGWYEYRYMDQTLQIAMISGSDATIAGTTLSAAPTIQTGQWVTAADSGYFCIGDLEAGDEVRVYGEGLGSAWAYLCDENGNYGYTDIYSDADGSVFPVTTAGTYYVKTGKSLTISSDGSLNTYRLLVDVATQDAADDTVYQVEGAEDRTMVVGDSVPLHLRLCPTGTKVGTSDTRCLFYVTTGNSSVARYYDGYLTAYGTGTATITVRDYSDNRIVYATFTVTVVESSSNPATAISVSGAPDTALALGDTCTLTATLEPADVSATVTWTSSDPSILYVNSKGVVTAVGNGEATITAAVGDVSDSVTIATTAAPETVAVKSVRLSKTSMTLYAGESSQQLTATVSPANAANATVTWSSSMPSVATVDQDGNVTPVGHGIALIYASAGSCKASCTVTVQPARVRVTGVSLDATGPLELPLTGSGVKLQATIAPSDATTQTVTWVSSDERVATVSRTGVVTPLSVGETTITVTTVDGEKTASVVVNVVASAQLGDINMDGYIDSADAMIALKVAVGKRVLTTAEQAVADVNGDGYVDAADAIRILRYDAKLIDSLK